MSAEEILTSLPKLTLGERREICQKILELEGDPDTLQFATEVADTAFQQLDD